MFELNKLNVYSEAQNLTIEVLETVSKVTKGDEAVLTEVRIQAIYLLKQIARAEGSYNQKEKRIAFTTAKSYVYQVYSLLDLMNKLGMLKEDKLTYFNGKYFTLVKMISSLAKKINDQLKTA